MTILEVELKHFTWDEAASAGLRTKTAWSQAGRSLLRDAKPAALHNGRYDTYYLYDESQTRSKRVVNERPPVSIDLLAAIFTATRSAKRYRDAAQAHYLNDHHGFAGTSRKRKEYLYTLKDNGIVAAVHQGRLQAVGRHGVLTVYRGEGYCFHSLLRPKESLLPEVGTEPLTVEAKPKESDEPRLTDACQTLEQLPGAADAVNAVEFDRLSFPARMRKARHRHDYEEKEDSEYDY